MMGMAMWTPGPSTATCQTQIIRETSTATSTSPTFLLDDYSAFKSYPTRRIIKSTRVWSYSYEQEKMDSRIQIFKWVERKKDQRVVDIQQTEGMDYRRIIQLRRCTHFSGKPTRLQQPVNRDRRHNARKQYIYKLRSTK